MSTWTGRMTVGGKLMLAGEYSVLGSGGSAISVAVKPGLSVRLADASCWSLLREDIGVQYTLDNGEPPEPLRFAALALAAVLHKYPELVESPAQLIFEPIDAYGTGTTKPGVGGSASATVATMASALRRLPKPVSVDELIALAIRVHRDAQGGRGSGYDIATIAHGGLVEYRPVQLSGPTGPTVESARIEWPKGLRLIAGYTGHSASTTALLKELENRAKQDRVGTVRALQELGRPVSHLADCLRSGSFDAVKQSVFACHEALQVFDQTCNLGIMTPEVEKMIHLANSVGAASKVSGAGGGDSVVALVPNAEMEATVREAWLSHSFQLLPVEVSMDSPILG